MNHIDTLKIDYHLSYYQSACNKLVDGIADPKEFARIEAIRDASLCAIALEANLITAIGTGKLVDLTGKRRSHGLSNINAKR